LTLLIIASVSAAGFIDIAMRCSSLRGGYHGSVGMRKAFSGDLLTLSCLEKSKKEIALYNYGNTDFQSFIVILQ